MNELIKLINSLINQLVTNRYELFFLKCGARGARGNKLSSCKIPDQYLKKQKSYETLRTLAT